MTNMSANIRKSNPRNGTSKHHGALSLASKDAFQEETALAESANGAQLPERDLDDQSVEMVRNILIASSIFYLQNQGLPNGVDTLSFSIIKPEGVTVEVI